MSIVSLFGGYAVGVRRSGSSAGKGVEVGKKPTASKTRSAAQADWLSDANFDHDAVQVGMRKMKSQTSNAVEIQRLRYSHIEAMFSLVIVALIAVGGLFALMSGNDKGLTILLSILSLLGGYVLGVSRKKSGSRATD
jgi:hypothetical protein